MNPHEKMVGIVGAILVFGFAYMLLGGGNAANIIAGSVRGERVQSQELIDAPSTVVLSFSEVKEKSIAQQKGNQSKIFSTEVFGFPEVGATSRARTTDSMTGGLAYRLDREGKVQLDAQVVPNSYIVEFSAPITIQESRVAESSVIDNQLNAIQRYTIRKIARGHENDSVSSFMVVDFLENPFSAHLALERISAIPGVVSVTPNHIAKTTQTITPTVAPTSQSPTLNAQPNDPYFGQQYMHRKIGSKDSWMSVSGGGSVIAVIDTGVDYQHEDLQANIWRNSGEIPNNGIDDEGNGYVDDVIGYDFVDTSSPLCGLPEDCLNEDNDPNDYVGHGTHIAGIIAAVANNQKGVVGACPQCKVMVLRAGYAPGAMEYADIMQSIIYATDNGAHIISMSFGGDFDDPGMKAALDYAYSRGVLLVAAAGNNSNDTPNYPGAYENVISVTATDAQDAAAYFSSYGYTTDVAAPGVDILSTVPTNGYFLSLNYPPLPTDSKYALFSGTSMATPIVAGVAGLVRASSSGMSVQAFQSVMVGSAQTFGNDIQSNPYRYIGSGRVYGPRALERARSGPTAILRLDDSTFDHVQFGNAPVAGTAASGDFGKVEFEVRDLYGMTFHSGYSTQLNSPVTNGALTTSPLESHADGSFMLRATLKNASGNILRLIEKPIQIQNVEVTQPIHYSTINPQNGAISFFGSIAGDSLIQYTLEFRSDPSQPFSSQGFTYTNNHVKKVDELLATWTPPITLPESVAVEVRINIQFPQTTNVSQVYYFLVDRTIKQGWPVTMKLVGEDVSNPYYHFVPWKSANGMRTNRILVYNSAPDSAWWDPNATIRVYTSAGMEAAGWPRILPQQLNQGNESYDLSPNGVSETPTLADIDGDGKDELLVHAIYAHQNLSTERYFQSAVFAFNEDGSAVSGFPIFTHHASPVPYFQDVLFNAPVVAADLDGDGVLELIVYTSEANDGQNKESFLGVARKDSQGAYQFSSISIQTPTFIWSSGDPLRTLLTIQNVDSDPNLEIVGISTPRGQGDPSGQGWAFESTIFALNEDGSLVSGWPITIGDAQNFSVFDEVLGISSGTMAGQTVIGLTVGHFIWTTPPNGIATFDFYLIDTSGQTLPGWPKNFTISDVSDTQAPIFADVDGDGVHEVVFTEQNNIHAFDVQGNEVWARTLANPSNQSFSDRTLVGMKQNTQPTLLSGFYGNHFVLGAGVTETSTQLLAFPTNQPTPAWYHNHLITLGGEPTLSTDVSGSTIGQASWFFDYWSDPYYVIFQLVEWDDTTGLVEGDWPYFMQNRARTNAGEFDCVLPTDGMMIYESTILCSGNHALPNGITIWNMGTENIQLSCPLGTVLYGFSQPGSVGISINNSAPGQGSVSVDGCSIQDYAVGIGLYRWSSVSLTNTNLLNNTKGIDVELPTLATTPLIGMIQGNTITGSTTAIRVVNYPGMSVSSNTISASANGIYIDHSNGTTLSQNILTAPAGNTGTGIKSEFTNSVVATNNTVNKFQLNMDLGINSNFWVAHTNNFYKKTGATANVKDVGLSNKWYNTITNKGNYWSDHTCTDNQAPFGVCENAYVIDTDSKDLKPLKNPV